MATGFEITLYKFYKKTNSDLKPVIGQNVQIEDALTLQDVRLKSNTSLINPVLILNISSDDIPTYNYCYIPKFNRYYFVGDTVYNPPMWNIYLTVDALATYREFIIEQEQYIDRASHQTAVDNDVIDTAYPTTTNTLSTTVFTDFGDLVTGWDGGCFVIGVINGQTRANGSVAYYVMTHLELSQLANAMMGGSTYLNITDISEDMVKVLFDPFQYIVSCTWFPVSRTHMPINTTSTTIRFGWWDSGVTTYALDSSGVYTLSGYIGLVKHPQISQTVHDPYFDIDITYQLKYLQNNPYSEYTLIYGPFGEIPLDATKLYDKSNLYLWMTIDCISGLGKLYIAAENDITKAFKIVRANCGTDVQLAKVGSTALNNIGQTIQSAAEMASGAVSTFGAGVGGILNEPGTGNRAHSGAAATASIINNWISDRVSGGSDGGGGSVGFNIGGLIQTGLQAAGSMVATSIASKFPGMQTVGSTGSVVEWARPPIIQNRFYNIAGVDILHKGCPACKRLAIAAYPGFYQMNMPELEIPVATTAEKEIIAAHMQAGFYHE